MDLNRLNWSAFPGPAAANGAPPRTPAPSTPHSDQSMARQRTIVVADDESHIRLVVGEKLRAAGFKVIEAGDGEEALEAVRTHLPDALITDLQMPYMNGLEVCTHLAADPRTSRIPAILLTARGHILADELVARTGIRRVMGKPFGVRDLVQYVEEVLLAANSASVATAAEPAGASKSFTPACEAA